VSRTYDVTVTVADVDISDWVAAGATIDRGRASTGEGFTAPQAVFDVFTAAATPVGLDPDDAPVLADGDEVLIHVTHDGVTQWRRFTGKIQALDWSPYRYRVTAAGNSVDLAAAQVLDTYGVDPTPAIPIPAEQDIPSTGPTLPGRVGRIADELGITINIVGTQGRWLLGIPENTPGVNALEALLDIASDCDGLLRETVLGDIDYVARVHDRDARYLLPADVVEHDTLDLNLERGLIRNSISVFYGDIDEDTGEQPRAYSINTPSVIEMGERPGDPIPTQLRFLVGAQGKGARWLTNHQRAWAASDITLVMYAATEDEADEILALEEGDPVRLGPMPDGAPMTYYDADILGFTEIVHQQDYRIILHLSPGSPAEGEDDGNWVEDGTITGGDSTGTYVVGGREWRWHAFTTPGDADLEVTADVTARALIIGAGGDGGDGHTNGPFTYKGGGGGSGAVYEQDGVYLPVGTHTVTVGANPGGDSQLFDVIAYGGGDGGIGGFGGNDGGSGGGGGGEVLGTAGGDATGGSIDGGATSTLTGFDGANGTSATLTPGHGGSASTSSDITGSTVVYAVGGTGGGSAAGTGPGDGGDGANGGTGTPGYDGADGAVIIAYRISPGTGYAFTDAVWAIDAWTHTGTDTVQNIGTSGSALNAQSGSTSGSDSADPKWLEYDSAVGQYAYLPGVGSNLLSVPDAAALDLPITGDLDVRVRCAMDDWTPATESSLVSRQAATASWRLNLRTDGTLILVWFASTVTKFAISTAATGLTDGAVKWVRATLDVNNGAAGNDVKFWMSDDGTSWTQLGATVTAAGVTSIDPGTVGVRVGMRDGDQLSAGKFYRAMVLDGIGGTTIVDIDCAAITSGSATSFTATVGGTCTVDRTTSGRKTALVGGWAGGGSLFLFGTDDYLHIADHADLDFTASDSFTLLTCHRAWGTLGTNDVLLAKKANTTAATTGWSLTAGSSTAAQGQGQIGDGTNGTTAVSGSRTAGALSTTITVRNVTADTLTTYLDGTAGTPVTDATTGTLANSEAMRVGRLSGAGTEYADMELVAAAIWRRALTVDEIDVVLAYLTGRTP
jgi:hypothetical protein